MTRTREDVAARTEAATAGVPTPRMPARRLVVERPATQLLDEGDHVRARPLRPENRLNVLGALAATSLAFLAYFGALNWEVAPPPAFSGALFAIAPACAIPAAVLLAVRARAEQDEALRAVTAGLVIGCVAMVFQLLAFRPIDPGGGVFATTSTGSTSLYLLWHLALPAGALAATIGCPRRSRARIGMAVGILAAVLFATGLPNWWHVAHADGSYFGTYVLALIAVIVFTIVAVLRWVRRTGLRPTATRGWITIALLLSIYDAALNALGHRRYSDVWWASLSIRSATYAVLLGGLIVSTATQLHRLERYTTSELARAEGEVNSWAEVTERLLATTSALSAAVTAPDVAQLLAVAGAGAVEADDAALYAVDDADTGRLRLIGGLSAGRQAPLLEATPGTPHGDALLGRTPVFLESAAQIARAYRVGSGLPARHSMQALVALPLIVGDAAVGVLLVTGTRHREFRRLDRQLLTALVRVGAQALQRAMLYEQQSSLATTLQEALLPQSLPARRDVELIGRYLPATAGVDVGGDWYDVLETGGSQLLLVVGDVMGKGVPAATLMGQLRSAVRTLAAVDPDPAAILSGLDQLATGFPPDDIVTLVIVALDVESGAALVANAGHLPPLVFAPGRPGAPATAARDISPPIGAPVTGPRAISPLQLPAGAALLLLTDGLVEERDSDLDARMRGLTERATELLADADADLEAVTDALVQPRVHRDDDVTLLVARLRPAVPGGGRPATSRAPDTRLLDIALGGDAGTVAKTRAIVRDAVRSRGIAVPPEVMDSLLLVTSELVTNGLSHGEPPVQLCVDHTEHRLRVTVTDRGASQPRPRVAGPEAIGGRGLFLVSALATAWKIEPHGDRSSDGPGTAVWAEFAI